MNPYTYKKRKPGKHGINHKGFFPALFSAEVNFLTVLAFIFFMFTALTAIVVLQTYEIGDEGVQNLATRKIVKQDTKVLGASSTIPSIEK